MAYSGDQLQSVDATKPLDTDPESSIGQELRDLKAAILGWVDVEHLRTGKHIRPYAVDTGSVNVYQVTIALGITSLDTGFSVKFKPLNTNTGAATIEIICGTTSLGTYDIKKAGNAVTAGDIIADRIVDLLFDGTNFELVNPPAETIVAGTISGLRLITNQESGFSYQGNTLAAVTLATLNVPINSYAKIMAEVSIDCVNLIAPTLFTVRLNHGATLLEQHRLWVPKGLDGVSAAVELSNVIDGGQTSVTQIIADAVFGQANADIKAKVKHIRLWAVA